MIGLTMNVFCEVDWISSKIFDEIYDSQFNIKIQRKGSAISLVILRSNLFNLSNIKFLRYKLVILSYNKKYYILSPAFSCALYVSVNIHSIWGPFGLLKS